MKLGDKGDIRPFLIKIGVALTLSLASFFYCRLRNKRPKPSLPPPSSLPHNSGLIFFLFSISFSFDFDFDLGFDFLFLMVSCHVFVLGFNGSLESRGRALCKIDVSSCRMFNFLFLFCP